jgi:Na+-transporting methylmalonyl-CoA/oxaloacetate decarboxylase gamma subunit
MKTGISIFAICSFLIVSIFTIAAFAQPKTKAEAPPPLQASDLANVLKIVAQTQDDVKALRIAVATLAANQKDQTAQLSTQLQDVARRLYATCILTQRQMDIVVPGGWSENMLCTYRGLTAGGEAVTRDIFGQNPVSIDTAFGGP